MYETISLFEPQNSRDIVKFVEKKVCSHINPERYSCLFISPSVQKVEILVPHLTNFSLMSRKSPYSDLRSSLRQCSVSGFSSNEEARKILEALTSEPFRHKTVGDTVHVHLANRQSIKREDNSQKEEKQADLFEVIEPKLSLNDLVLSEKIKKRILSNVNLIKHRDVFLIEFGFADIPGLSNKLPLSLNLVGESGVGKTAIAEAIARILGKLLMVVDLAELQSKYPGDTEKNIKKIFEQATDQDVVLLFDEADPVLGKRVEVRQSYDNSVNNARSVMLLELSKFDGVVLFTTNLASNYDPAFRRRILDHIEIPKPDEEARALILEKHTPTKLPGREQLDFRLLASKSEGFSGSDMAEVIKKAALKLLDEVAQGSPEIMISNEDCLEAIEEIKEGQKLLQDTTRLKEVTPDEIVEEVSKEENESEEDDR